MTYERTCVKPVKSGESERDRSLILFGFGAAMMCCNTTHSILRVSTCPQRLTLSFAKGL